MEAALQSPVHQKVLTRRREDYQFEPLLFKSLALPNRAQLLTASSPQCFVMVQVVPALGLNLHLDRLEFQTGVMWRL